MSPNAKNAEIEKKDEARLQEQFIRQVEDHSKPAQEVLADQQERRSPNEAPALFVP